MPASEIMSIIEKMVQAKARELYTLSYIAQDKEDIQQELMVNIIKSLEKFDIKHGNILSFVKLIINKRAIDVQKAMFKDKRIIALKSVSLSDTEYQIKDDSDTLQELTKERAIEELPQTYQNIILMLKTHKLRDIKNKLGLSAEDIKDTIPSIRKLLEEQENVLFRNNKKMKNISCIELLDTHELAKLSEADLADLTEKINQTYNWTKQLKSKLEKAIKTKYMTEIMLRTNNRDENNSERFIVDNEDYRVIIDLPSNIEWKQDILAEIYKNGNEEIKSNIELTYYVDEKKYQRLDAKTRCIFDKARIKTYSGAKIKMEKKNENN